MYGHTFELTFRNIYTNGCTNIQEYIHKRIRITSCTSLLKCSNAARLALDGQPEHDGAVDANGDNAPVHDEGGAVVLVVDGFA